jgi:hypothetical protein
MGPRAEAHDTELAIERVRPEELALRTLPMVVHVVVREPGRAEPKSAAMGVCGEPLERERPDREAGRIGRGEHDLRSHTSLAAAASSSPAVLIPAGSRTSVKRLSGSSSVTCLTVWRIPRYAM